MASGWATIDGATRGVCVGMGTPSCGCSQPQSGPGCLQGDLVGGFMRGERRLLCHGQLTLNSSKLLDFTRRLSKCSELLTRCRGAESVTPQAEVR